MRGGRSKLGGARALLVTPSRGPRDATASSHDAGGTEICTQTHGVRAGADDHVDTGRWVGTDRKDMLCQVCHSLQDVEDEQHFIFECPAYSHLRIKHASLFQQVCTVSDFMAKCEPNTCGGFLRNCFPHEEMLIT